VSDRFACSTRADNRDISSINRESSLMERSQRSLAIGVVPDKLAVVDHRINGANSQGLTINTVNKFQGQFFVGSCYVGSDKAH
jgi:hypothetical protein